MNYRNELKNEDTHPTSKYNEDTMVSIYGPDWNIWKGNLSCPHCKMDLRDHDNGPPFTKEIAVISSEKDRVICFLCPECMGTW